MASIEAHMTSRVYLSGLVLVAAALISAWLAGWAPDTEIKSQLFEIGLQVLVFGILGGGVKLLLDHQNDLEEFRSEMLERLGRAHREVYRIRRLLPTASDDARRALLGELMDARQDLGDTYHAARGWGLNKKLDETRAHINAMRDYLEEVIEGALEPAEPSKRAAYEAFIDFRNSVPAYENGFKASYVSAKAVVDPTSVRKEDLPRAK
jgi:hypothetical protein